MNFNYPKKKKKREREKKGNNITLELSLYVYIRSNIEMCKIYHILMLQFNRRQVSFVFC